MVGTIRIPDKELKQEAQLLKAHAITILWYEVQERIWRFARKGLLDRGCYLSRVDSLISKCGLALMMAAAVVRFSCHANRRPGRLSPTRRNSHLSSLNQIFASQFNGRCR